MSELTEVMSFGGGIQSTAIMTLAGEGHIPMPSRWVFSDPQFEGEKTYAHIERCKEYLAARGANLHVVTAGNIEKDAVQFAERRSNSTVQRYASIPMFILKEGEKKEARLPRQCTSEYKIRPIEEFHRREVLGLKFRERAPKTPVVNVWIGISLDEERRATPPGRWRRVKVEIGKSLFGEPLIEEREIWEPVKWQLKTFPLLGYALDSDRRRIEDDRFDFCADWKREDCKKWLEKSWPWPVPRSACICCPYRTNAEWIEMRDNDPQDWARAVAFDERIREAYSTGQKARGHIAGVPYLHRRLVPLAMADLGEALNDRMGCGSLYSQEPDGICGV